MPRAIAWPVEKPVSNERDERFGLVGQASSAGPDRARLVVIAFGFQLEIDEQSIRLMAAGLLTIAGLVLLMPSLQGRLTAAATPLTNRASHALGRVRGDGLHGQFLIGLLLGLVWAPCVGPTFGATLLLVGLLVLTGYDKVIESIALSLMPDWLISFTTRL